MSATGARSTCLICGPRRAIPSNTSVRSAYMAMFKGCRTLSSNRSRETVLILAVLRGFPTRKTSSPSIERAGLNARWSFESRNLAFRSEDELHGLEPPVFVEAEHLSLVQGDDLEVHGHGVPFRRNRERALASRQSFTCSRSVPTSGEQATPHGPSRSAKPKGSVRTSEPPGRNEGRSLPPSSPAFLLES